MSTALPREPDLTVRQRWLAARRLAAGEPLVVAAAAAAVNARSLRLVLAEDPDFIELVDAFRAIKALSREEKRARLEDLCWDGAERAILDSRVSTLNLCLKTLKLVDSPQAEDEDDDPLQAVLDSMSDEEYADYLSLGDEEELTVVRRPVERSTLDPAVKPRGDKTVEETPAKPAPTAPSGSRERSTPAPSAEPVTAEPAAAATPAPVPLFHLPTATAACAYGPACLELPRTPGTDQEKLAAAALGWPYVEPAGVPPVIWTAAPWRKPAGSGFPRRPP